jgi:RNA polymerase primary sigma factor
MNKKYINFDVDDSVSKYFKDVRKSVLITAEEEIALAKRIKKGDKEAIDELVNANLKFVVSIAKDYQGQGLLLSDLISEGNYGLVKAATRFDYKRGFRFISYAVWWIKQSIIQSLNDNSRVVRLPTNVINRISKLNKEISKFEHINEREPVFGDLMDGDSVISMIKYPKCLSLNECINEEGDELMELIPGDVPDENRIEIDNSVKNQLNKTLSVLDDRERNIIDCYFGIDTNCEAMTLEGIGEKYGLTKERIRQIKNKALRKLRNNSSNLFDLINE